MESPIIHKFKPYFSYFVFQEIYINLQELENINYGYIDDLLE